MLAWLALEVKTLVMSPIPWWVGPYAHPIRLYLGSGSLYLSSPPGGAVLSAHHSIGMTFVWSEGIDVPLVVVLVE